jgi:hypothetical protein
MYPPAWLRPGPSVPTMSGPRILPTAPIPTGLLLNTFFYSAILWTVLFARGILIRSLRLRRRHCIHCDYDRAGLASGSACPECAEK